MPDHDRIKIAYRATCTRAQLNRFAPGAGNLWLRGQLIAAKFLFVSISNSIRMHF